MYAEQGSDTARSAVQLPVLTPTFSTDNITVHKSGTEYTPSLASTRSLSYNTLKKQQQQQQHVGHLSGNSSHTNSRRKLTGLLQSMAQGPTAYRIEVDTDVQPAPPQQHQAAPFTEHKQQSPPASHATHHSERPHASTQSLSGLTGQPLHKPLAYEPFSEHLAQSIQSQSHSHNRPAFHLPLSEIFDSSVPLTQRSSQPEPSQPAQPSIRLIPVPREEHSFFSKSHSQRTLDGSYSARQLSPERSLKQLPNQPLSVRAAAPSHHSSTHSLHSSALHTRTHTRNSSLTTLDNHSARHAASIPSLPHTDLTALMTEHAALVEQKYAELTKQHPSKEYPKPTWMRHRRTKSTQAEDSVSARGNNTDKLEHSSSYKKVRSMEDVKLPLPRLFPDMSDAEEVRKLQEEQNAARERAALFGAPGAASPAVQPTQGKDVPAAPLSGQGLLKQVLQTQHSKQQPNGATPNTLMPPAASSPTNHNNKNADSTTALVKPKVTLASLAARVLLQPKLHPNNPNANQFQGDVVVGANSGDAQESEKHKLDFIKVVRYAQIFLKGMQPIKRIPTHKTFQSQEDTVDRWLRLRLKAGKRHIKEEERLKAREMFDMLDFDHSNSIELSELRDALKALGMDCSLEEMAYRMRKLDVSGNGALAFDEFLAGFQVISDWDDLYRLVEFKRAKEVKQQLDQKMQEEKRMMEAERRARSLSPPKKDSPKKRKSVLSNAPAATTDPVTATAPHVNEKWKHLNVGFQAGSSLAGDDIGLEAHNFKPTTVSGSLSHSTSMSKPPEQDPSLMLLERSKGASLPISGDAEQAAMDGDPFVSPRTDDTWRRVDLPFFLWVPAYHRHRTMNEIMTSKKALPRPTLADIEAEEKQKAEQEKLEEEKAAVQAKIDNIKRTQQVQQGNKQNNKKKTKAEFDVNNPFSPFYKNKDKYWGSEQVLRALHYKNLALAGGGRTAHASVVNDEVVNAAPGSQLASPQPTGRSPLSRVGTTASRTISRMGTAVARTPRAAAAVPLGGTLPPLPPLSEAPSHPLRPASDSQRVDILSTEDESENTAVDDNVAIVTVPVPSIPKASKRSSQRRPKYVGIMTTIELRKDDATEEGNEEQEAAVSDEDEEVAKPKTAGSSRSRRSTGTDSGSGTKPTTPHRPKTPHSKPGTARGGTGRKGTAAGAAHEEIPSVNIPLSLFAGSDVTTAIAKEQAKKDKQAGSDAQAAAAAAASQHRTSSSHSARGTTPGGGKRPKPKEDEEPPQKREKLEMMHLSDPMIKAAKNGLWEEVLLLIQTLGGDDPKSRSNYVNRRDKNGSTAIFHCVWPGHAKVLEVLLYHGADPNIRNNRMNTALHLACEKGHRPLIKLMIDHGANTTLTNWQSRTAAEMIAGFAGREPEEEADLQKFVKECIEAYEAAQQQQASGKSAAADQLEHGLFGADDALPTPPPMTPVNLWEFSDYDLKRAGVRSIYFSSGVTAKFATGEVDTKMTTEKRMQEALEEERQRAVLQAVREELAKHSLSELWSKTQQEVAIKKMGQSKAITYDVTKADQLRNRVKRRLATQALKHHSVQTSAL